MRKPLPYGRGSVRPTLLKHALSDKHAVVTDAGWPQGLLGREASTADGGRTGFIKWRPAESADPSSAHLPRKRHSDLRIRRAACRGNRSTRDLGLRPAAPPIGRLVAPVLLSASVVWSYQQTYSTSGVPGLAVRSNNRDFCCKHLEYNSLQWRRETSARHGCIAGAGNITHLGNPIGDHHPNVRA